MIPKYGSNEILNPGPNVIDPAAQIHHLYSRPSFGYENTQILSHAPENPPQIYRGHRKKFGRTYINILHDPRVVRGNTYAAFVIPSSLQMEFLRMKEEEEKRKKLMRIPKKLPRVALMGKNRRGEDREGGVENVVRDESPILKPIEVKGEVEDKPYFFEDRPNTPKYIPLPKGRDEETQIIDGELFDFEMEVKPILEVLVGRSVIQAQYELIEEFEREEYLNHKKKFERKREFELNKLQRTEAKYIRQEEEKQRRFKQTEQRKINDIIMQKKLMSNVFSKHFLKNLKGNTFRNLQERGFLSFHDTYETSLFMQKEYLPKAEKMNVIIGFIDDDLIPKIKNEIDEELLAKHQLALQKEKNRIEELNERKQKAKEAAEKAEKERREAQLERREKRRVERITNNVKTKILDQFTNRKDIYNMPLVDIDELTIKGESIHCLGGQLGEILFVFSEVMKNIEPEKTNEIDLKKILKDFLKEFLSTGLAGLIPIKPDPTNVEEKKDKNAQQQQQQPPQVALPNNVSSDNFILELKYLESPKYDWENIAEDKKNDFINFLKDDRRYISKSVHKLIELGLLKKEYLDLFNEVISEIYFQGPIELEKKEPDPTKAEDQAYQEEFKKEQEEAEKKNQEENAFNEKLKKKIKITLLKPEIFKKKRNNIGAFITIEPNPTDKGLIQEIEEIPVSARQIEEKNEENKNEENNEENKNEGEEQPKEATQPENQENANAEKKDEKKEEKKEEEKKEEKKEEEKKEEEKKEEEAPNQEGAQQNGTPNEEVKPQSKFL